MSEGLDDETREIIASFISEGYERLDDAEAVLEKLDSSTAAEAPDDPENIQKLNSVFRLFHSVKGSAGYLNFENIKILTHEAEALLEVFIKGGVKPTPESFDVIYKTVDVLRDLIGLVERVMSDRDGAAQSRDQANAIANHVADLKARAQAPSIKTEPSPAVPPSMAPPPVPKSLPPNQVLLSELVTADMVERFLAECADLVDGAEKQALEFDRGADDVEAVNNIFRAIHTIKGNAGFFGYVLLEALCMDFEALLEGVRKGGRPLDETFTASVMASIDLLRSSIGSVSIIAAGSPAEPAILLR